MKTSWHLWLQLYRRMPLLAVASNLMWLGALVLAILRLSGTPGLTPAITGLFAMATWFWHFGQGFNLRGLCMPESFLLPDFRRRLLEYGAIDAVQWVVLPAVISALLHVPHLPLIASGMVLIAVAGVMMGCSPRSSLLIWPILILLGWMPALAAEVLKVAAQSLLSPLLLLAIAALILRLSVMPLLRIEDREVDNSPLESTSLGRFQARDRPGDLRRTGALGKRINALFDATAQRAMTRALAAYRRSPAAGRRLTLLRRLLLPHDNPEAIALRIGLIAVFVCFYFFVVMHRQRFDAAAIGAYAILISISRFPQLNRGLTRMRPNMADLFLTLAPQTRAEYQKTLSDALLVLVPISLLTALAYTALGAVLVHATDPWRMLFVAAIVATASSLAALAVHMVGPEGMTGRGIANLALMSGSMGVYWGGYWLVSAIGYLLGGGLLAVITLGFGFGAWFAAQREYQQRTPRFDAPIG